MRRPVIVTDLDGTLLNHDDYRWAPAVPALARAQAAGVGGGARPALRSLRRARGAAARLVRPERLLING